MADGPPSESDDDPGKTHYYGDGCDDPHGRPGAGVEPPSDSHPNERRCADCGRIVTKYRGKWADRDGRPGRKYQTGYDFCCRFVMGEMGKLASADYHYVAGETQRHWVAP